MNTGKGQDNDEKKQAFISPRAVAAMFHDGEVEQADRPTMIRLYIRAQVGVWARGSTRDKLYFASSARIARELGVEEHEVRNAVRYSKLIRRAGGGHGRGKSKAFSVGRFGCSGGDSHLSGNGCTGGDSARQLAVTAHGAGGDSARVLAVTAHATGSKALKEGFREGKEGRASGSALSQDPPLGGILKEEDEEKRLPGPKAGKSINEKKARAKPEMPDLSLPVPVDGNIETPPVFAAAFVGLKSKGAQPNRRDIRAAEDFLRDDVGTVNRDHLNLRLFLRSLIASRRLASVRWLSELGDEWRRYVETGGLSGDREAVKEAIVACETYERAELAAMDEEEESTDSTGFLDGFKVA